MSNWDRTYKNDEISVDLLCGQIHVWTAISDSVPPRAIANIEIHNRTEFSQSSSLMRLTADQMRDLARLLVVHADRLESLNHEVAFLTSEAA
jgi:hypothetical protein